MTEKERFFKKLDFYTEKLSKELPEIPLMDLRLILYNLLKPKRWPRRFLLRKIGENQYVP